MCGRFAFYSPREAVRAVFGVELPFEVVAQYNLAPTQLVAAIRAIHDRMPEGLLRFHEVSRAVNSPAHDGPELIATRARAVT